MIAFTTKKIDTPESLGEKLMSARKSQGFTLEKISKLTNIQLCYLQALEEGNYNQLPGEVYAKCFLKTYAKLLKMDIDKLLVLYNRERKIYKNTKKVELDISKPVKKASRIHFLVTPKIVRNLIISLILLICFLYLGAKVKAIINPPLLVVNSPIDNLLTKERVITVSGSTEKETLVIINGQKVLVNDQGNFSELIDLQLGVNLIKITAKKDHSKENIIYRRIVVSEEEGG